MQASQWELWLRRVWTTRLPVQLTPTVWTESGTRTTTCQMRRCSPAARISPGSSSKTFPTLMWVKSIDSDQSWNNSLMTKLDKKHFFDDLLVTFVNFQAKYQKNNCSLEMTFGFMAIWVYHSDSNKYWMDCNGLKFSQAFIQRIKPNDSSDPLIFPPASPATNIHASSFIVKYLKEKNGWMDRH